MHRVKDLLCHSVLTTLDLSLLTGPVRGIDRVWAPEWLSLSDFLSPSSKLLFWRSDICIDTYTELSPPDGHSSLYSATSQRFSNLSVKSHSWTRNHTEEPKAFHPFFLIAINIAYCTLDTFLFKTRSRINWAHPAQPVSAPLILTSRKEAPVCRASLHGATAEAHHLLFNCSSWPSGGSQNTVKV